MSIRTPSTNATAHAARAPSSAPSVPERFAYERLAADIGELIRTGTLRPGDRVPSVRRMSASRGVSMPTVMQAYRLLEARRLIGARPQSGFYVLPPQARAGLTKHEPTVALPEPGAITTGDLIMRVLEMVANPELVPLGTALPAEELLPTGALARALRGVTRPRPGSARAPVTPSGSEELRREIARRALDAGDAVTPDDIVVTCGCAEALSLCLRALTRPGDTVAVEAPAYFGTLQAIEVLGLRALEIPVDPDTGLHVEALAEALGRTKVAALVVTPNVHNPLGCIMPDDRKRELVSVLAAHGVPAIEDDTYGELAFGDARPRTLRAFDTASLVLTCGSFSKTLAPEYRVGWVIPGPWRDRVLHLKLATTSATAVPPQLALAAYLGSGGYEQHLRRLRRSLRGTVERLSFEITERFPEGTRISRPAGGYLLWVQLPDGIDTVALQRQAMSRGLSVAPGPAFSASGAFANYLRINAGHPWSARTRDALDLLAELIASMDPRKASRRSGVVEIRRR
ncbi:MAG: PLP-dependent aminotransferase family protein [Gemmatimonadaceae bacterium]